MNIYIGEPVVVSDMQGPCPDGFHVPKDAEWTGLMSIMNSIGATAYNSYRIKLHLPYLGYRFYSNTTIENLGEYGYYQSCNASSNGYRLAFRFGDVDYWSGNQYMSYGYGIRGFKNSFEKPNSSWTVIQGTIGGAGIFWNQADGIISITSNGTTGYTIMDKNLGATTVYNDGDTLSEANCGYYYQRGNNYGFAGIGGSNPSTSSSTVNVSTYGPGNYYKSSTWITSWNPYSSYNANLRGGTSQGTSTKSVEVQNIYIGEYVKPDYLCFTANTAGSTIKLTKTGSPTSVILETSTDGENRSIYTIDNTIALTNIGDKVYWRNTSETDTGFNIGTNSRYRFSMTGSISANGDIGFLLNKNSTDTLNDHCFYQIFDSCTSLTTPPSLPATTLADNCYRLMFYGCTGLTSAPSLPATTLAGNCYQGMFTNCSALTVLPKLNALTLTTSCYQRMFQGCSNIKLSSTQTGTYQTAYRIPTTGTGTTATNAFYYMFYQTGGTFTSDPTINTTYYTSNTVV